MLVSIEAKCHREQERGCSEEGMEGSGACDGVTPTVKDSLCQSDVPDFQIRLVDLSHFAVTATKTDLKHRNHFFSY